MLQIGLKIETTRLPGEPPFIPPYRCHPPPTENRSRNRQQCPGVNFIGGEVVFEGGDAYGDKELCYLGSEAAGSTPEAVSEEFDCGVYSASAPMTNEHPYLVSFFLLCVVCVSAHKHACPLFSVFRRSRFRLCWLGRS